MQSYAELACVIRSSTSRTSTTSHVVQTTATSLPMQRSATQPTLVVLYIMVFSDTTCDGECKENVTAGLVESLTSANLSNISWQATDYYAKFNVVYSLITNERSQTIHRFLS